MANPITQYTGSVGTLQAAVPSGSTLVVPYPAGTTQATFSDGSYAGTGQVITNKNNVYLESAGAISLAYGASNITITNSSGLPWSAGDVLDYGFGRSGFNFNFTGKQTPQAAITDIPSVVKALVRAGIAY